MKGRVKRFQHTEAGTTEIIDGQRITWMVNMDRYPDAPLQFVLDDGEIVKMKTKEVLKMVNEYRFTATPKRKYRHLTVLDGEL